MVDSFKCQEFSRHIFYVIFDSDYEYTGKIFLRRTVTHSKEKICPSGCWFSISWKKHIDTEVIFKIYISWKFWLLLRIFYQEFSYGIVKPLVGQDIFSFTWNNSSETKKGYLKFMFAKFEWTINVNRSRSSLADGFTVSSVVKNLKVIALFCKKKIFLKNLNISTYVFLYIHIVVTFHADYEYLSRIL